MAFGLGDRDPLYGRCTLDTFAVTLICLRAVVLRYTPVGVPRLWFVHVGAETGMNMELLWTNAAAYSCAAKCAAPSLPLTP